MNSSVLTTETASKRGLSPLNLYKERSDLLARDLAGELELLSKGKKCSPLASVLKLLKKNLFKGYLHFEEETKAGGQSVKSAEWLLDNYYLLEQALQQVKNDMPAPYYRRLPKVRLQGSGELPQVYLLASALMRSNGGRLEIHYLETLLQFYQEEHPLTIGEIWAIPAMLRLSALQILTESLASVAQLLYEPSSHFDLPWPIDPKEESALDVSTADDALIASIVSLRLLATHDWNRFFETACLVEKELRQDPSSTYSSAEFDTRNRYRNEVEFLGDGSAIEELKVAQVALSLSLAGKTATEQNLGYYLIGEGRTALEQRLSFRPSFPERGRRFFRRHALFFYLGSISFLTFLLSLAVAVYGWFSGGSSALIVAGVLLSLIPISGAIAHLVNYFVTRAVAPRILTKLDLKEGVPESSATFVVIPTLIGGEGDVEPLLRRIETQFLGNNDPQIHFALLTDFTDAAREKMPQDDLLIALASEGIRALNLQYGTEEYQPFFLFHRKRLWNPGEGCWMAWERKRGKLEEFNRLLRGATNTSYNVQVGDLDALSKTRYVITLDEDTLLPHGTAKRLIGTLSHPLNQATFDSESGKLLSGYTILQPRIQVWPEEANLSLFTRVYSGDSSLDLYTRAVSDPYQDLFGEGSFVGKGIYDIDAFERTLEDRIPENALLSHDLFEGAYGRCGLTSDIVLYEGYVPHYLVMVQRTHRWVRGDWQLLPWLRKKVPTRSGARIKNPLSRLSRWKIFDNLRRSFLPVSVVALLVAGWFLLPGSKAFWTALALVAYLPSAILSLLNGGAIRRTSHGLQGDFQPMLQAFLRLFFEIAFLPYKAVAILDAVFRTLVRMCFTKKHLLQWVSAAQSVKMFGNRVGFFAVLRKMAIVPLFSLAMMATVLLRFPTAFFYSLPILLLWFFSPLIAMWISRVTLHEEEKLSPSQERLLRRLARSTWLYFEHFVGPEDHWLPPDHFQESPGGMIAHRTSPTNVGMLFLSTFSACDMGYIGVQELVVRLRNAFKGMESLESYRGHLLNWFDTKTLVSLNPRYVSTVDSGNLAASLMVVGQGCQDLSQNRLIRWSGLRDTLDLLLVTLEELELGEATQEIRKATGRLRKMAKELEATKNFGFETVATLLGENRLELESLLAELIENHHDRMELTTLKKFSTWVDRSRSHLSSLERDIDRFSPWLTSWGALAAAWKVFSDSPALAAAIEELKSIFPPHPSLEEIPGICIGAMEKLQLVVELCPAEEKQARELSRAFKEKLHLALLASEELLGELQALAERADAFAQGMDFSFLFEKKREVFHIGYNIDSGRLDDNYYDLLASEARTASLLAIGKGDVPSSHWLHMSRPLTKLSGSHALLSWSGTMFEYLMPIIFTRSYPGTLLDQSCRTAVDWQISYGREKGVPWGISESSYNHFDAAQTYQYRAFGIPELGYKRGLGNDLVIAPYASVLALSLRPSAVLQNIKRFEKMKALGLYGLYESIDYTPRRLAAQQQHALVRTYMVHHQGMILLSLSNYLLEHPAVKRFHANPQIQTVEYLLQEQNPKAITVEYSQPQKRGFLRAARDPVLLNEWIPSEGTSHPQLHSLSNGSLTLMLTASGGGFSRHQKTDLTRWRADSTLDRRGVWIYAQESGTGKVWSSTAQPAGGGVEKQGVQFFPHKVTFEQSHEEISLQTNLFLAPDADVEIRSLSLTNNSNQKRTITLTSYGELVLAPQEADHRHPAFSRLFIKSQYLKEERALFFQRRPRSQGEETLALGHFVVGNFSRLEVKGFETDRMRFLGRGGTARSPEALRPGSAGLTGSTGFTLDQIFSIQTEVTLAPYETRSLAFITVVAPSRTEVARLISRFSRWGEVERALDGAATAAVGEMRKRKINSRHLEFFGKLLSALTYPSSGLRAPAELLSQNRMGQSGLWSFALSGDYPILLLKQNDQDLHLLKVLLQAHAHWRGQGLQIDLVIFNPHEDGYEQALGNRIYRLLAQTGHDGWINARGGIFVLREDQLSDQDRVLLWSAARVILQSDAGSLEQQMQKGEKTSIRLPRFVAVHDPLPASDLSEEIPRPEGLLFDNGLGGFSPDGREYLIYLKKGENTPAPWSNVIANSEFGFLVSELGMGTSWAVNSGENRLTTWHNDPVLDPPAEALYLRDEDTGEVWSTTPGPARDEAPYLIRHGAGYSIFEHASYGIKQELRLFALPDAPLKVIHLRLENKTDRTRRISTTYYAEWVLGALREENAPYLIPEFDSRLSALLVRNPYSSEFSSRVAFLAGTRELSGMTTDRGEFLGESYASPAALGRLGLTGQVAAGRDPCAALQILIWLAPHESKEVTFLLGQGNDREESLELIRRYREPEAVEAAWQATHRHWDQILGAVQVKTPDPAMDIMVNRWLLYQSLSCRIWGRTAFYQSSGAYGYRDQLQDVLAFLQTRPDLAREQILRAASCQFKEGDVLHWWHPPQTRGIRSRISDNLIWLPFVTSWYLRVTEDFSILDEEVLFLSGSPLASDEQERYDNFKASQESASLYEHCRRALEKGATRSDRGLPLMGAGDWNDGMNRVGTEGRGESIWLAWFLITTLKDFAEVSEKRGELKEAESCRQKVEAYRQAVENYGWDGEWYRRAYFDDGSPVGSAQNTECQIDAISQSWAVISGEAMPERAHQGMNALNQRLIRREDRQLLLLDPPFDRSMKDPGYIKAYPPGVRENGGQYTHGVLWSIWAFSKMGDGDKASEIFSILNPISHGDTPEKRELYRVEPYVLTADIYGAAPHVGRGGWSWYTGSAAWMYRMGVENILGIHKRGESLHLNPSIPKDWSGYRIDYRFGETLYRIEIENPEGLNGGVGEIYKNGTLLSTVELPLQDDGEEHQIRVVLKSR